MADESTKPDNKFAPDIENAPKITLAGMEFPIPILSWRENRIVEPLIRKVLPVYYKFLKLGQSRLAMTKAIIDSQQATTFEEATAKLAADPASADAFMHEMADFDMPDWASDALATIVFTGITRGNRNFSRGEFDGMTFGLNDLFEAMSIVMQQTGVYRKVVDPKAVEAAIKGEEQAGPLSA